MQRLIALYRLIRRDIRILAFALRHPRRPAWLLPALAGLALYVLSPVDLLPDTLPLVGIVDDLVLIPLVVGRLPPELRNDVPD